MPSQSPDLNHIENILNMQNIYFLDMKIQKKKISNKVDFKQFLKEKWIKITVEKCLKLIELKPKRLHSESKAKNTVYKVILLFLDFTYLLYFYSHCLSASIFFYRKCYVFIFSHILHNYIINIIQNINSNN